MNCASMPALKLCLPRIQVRLSITCLMPWLKSKPTELVSPMRGAAELRRRR